MYVAVTFPKHITSQIVHYDVLLFYQSVFNSDKKLKLKKKNLVCTKLTLTANASPHARSTIT